MGLVELLQTIYMIVHSLYICIFQVWVAWEGFLFGLQEASDFVEVHKPLVSEKLLETISVSVHVTICLAIKYF